jgi:hypothetical protein
VGAAAVTIPHGLIIQNSDDIVRYILRRSDSASVSRC